MKTLTFSLALALAVFQPTASSFNILTFTERAKTLYFETADFTAETFENYLLFKGCLQTKIVVKQARYETAHFKSGIFKKHNNLFGMKLATKRETTASGFILADFGKVATYETWQDSATDYIIWQSVQAAKYDPTNYYAFLIECNYATNLDYVKTLKRIK
jgi:hypothetical protein